MTASPQELFKRHGIDYVETKKGAYTTKCPECNGGYLNVKIDGRGATWFCHQCDWSGPPKDNGRGGGGSDLGPIKAVFDYSNEVGERLFQVLKFEPLNQPKQFRQRTGPDQKKWSIKGVRRVLYRLPELVEDIAAGHVIFVVEGERDVDALRIRNVPATTNPMGATTEKKQANGSGWLASYTETLRGADIVICGDNDAQGREHVRIVACELHDVARRLRVLHLAKFWPDIEASDDITDWFEHGGGTVERLWEIVEQLPDYQTRAKANNSGAASASLVPCKIAETLEVFRHWLILPDPTPIYAVLGTVAANLLPGDPVWLGLIAPPSSAKTEILNSISALPYVVQAATLTPAGLLSGTPKRQHHLGAKGGLLRQIGEFGIISLKDFGSILSMRPDAKAEVLAALREVYDGAWTRHLGTDGGRTLSWKGKVGVVFGATGVIDSHYGVIGSMGDRFLLNRISPAEKGQLKQALKHVGAATAQMRKELAETVTRLFAGERREPRPLSEQEFEKLDSVVSLVVRLRGAVERDRQSRELEAVYGAEGPARLGLALERLLAGLDTIDVDRAVALEIIERLAMDSVPPLRRRAYQHLFAIAPAAADTPAIANALGLPTVTVRRALEDLAAYGLVERASHGPGKADLWTAR
jgi:hypothetical protein